MDKDLPGHLHQARRQVILHEGDGDHVHEISVGRRGELTEYIWKVENVELATVGIDIGSSTSHLMFATVRLQRKTQALSSAFVVVERRILWKSPILLTPFLPDGSIDARALEVFVARCHEDAGLDRGEIDTGAVILTGEAMKRSNARAIAELFAADSGKFVCASAGHDLECVLAAHGSGAVAMSREASSVVLNVDIGGGTTKLALVASGEILSTCAFAVGGRLIAFDSQGRIARIDEPAQLAAEACGVALRIGERPTPEAMARVVDALAEAAISIIGERKPNALAQTLLLTQPIDWSPAPQTILFSGGVSEYIYGREARDFADIAKSLATRILAACNSGRIAPAVSEPREGIRATVIGASQFTVQVSGKTIHVGAGIDLPLRNVPVIAPALALDDEISPAAVAAAIQNALARAPGGDENSPLALAIRWRGDPHHRRLRALAEGIATVVSLNAPLVLMVDGDIGRSLGHILEHELGIGRATLSIDGIQLKEFDFVDIGELIRPADVVPVVIKSLLFAGAPAHASQGVRASHPVKEENLE